MPTDFPLVFVSYRPREDSLVLKVPTHLVDVEKKEWLLLLLGISLVESYHNPWLRSTLIDFGLTVVLLILL